jgi:zinc-ribbon domain
MSEQFPAEATRLCPTCGAELAPGATFCGACGSLVPGSPSAPTGEAPTLLTPLASAETIPPEGETLPPMEAQPREPAASSAVSDSEELPASQPDLASQNGHRRWDIGRLFRRE